MANGPIAVLTNKPDAEVPVRLREESRKLGVDYATIDIKRPDWVEQLNALQHAQVIVRVGPVSYDQYRHRRAEISERYGSSLDRFLVAFNKADSYEIVHDAGIPGPHTQVVSPSALHDSPELPVVVKKLTGHQGRGVYLITSAGQIDQVYRQVAADDRIVLQEYVAESQGLHKRLFVVGNNVVASMTRQAPKDDFRSNSKGNVGQLYTPTEQEERLAIDATQAHGLSFAGVDLLDGKEGPLVLEVNPSPGLTIEQYSGVNIAREIVKWYVDTQ